MMANIYVLSAHNNPHVKGVVAAFRANSKHLVFYAGQSTIPVAKITNFNIPITEEHPTAAFREYVAGNAPGPLMYHMKKMTWADIVMLVAPGGISEHIEFGMALERGKRTVVILPMGVEASLWYHRADVIATGPSEALDLIRDFGLG